MRLLKWVGDRLRNDDYLEVVVCDMVQDGFDNDEIRLLFPDLTDKTIKRYSEFEAEWLEQQETRVKEIINALPDC